MLDYVYNYQIYTYLACKAVKRKKQTHFGLQLCKDDFFTNSISSEVG